MRNKEKGLLRKSFLFLYLVPFVSEVVSNSILISSSLSPFFSSSKVSFTFTVIIGDDLMLKHICYGSLICRVQIFKFHFLNTFLDSLPILSNCPLCFNQVIVFHFLFYSKYFFYFFIKWKFFTICLLFQFGSRWHFVALINTQFGDSFSDAIKSSKISLRVYLNRANCNFHFFSCQVIN